MYHIKPAEVNPWCTICLFYIKGIAGFLTLRTIYRCWICSKRSNRRSWPVSAYPSSPRCKDIPCILCIVPGPPLGWMQLHGRMHKPGWEGRAPSSHRNLFACWLLWVVRRCVCVSMCDELWTLFPMPFALFCCSNKQERNRLAEGKTTRKEPAVSNGRETLKI